MGFAPTGGIEAPVDLAVNLTSYVRYLHASNMSPKTVLTYSEVIRQLGDFLSGARHADRGRENSSIAHRGAHRESPGQVQARHRP